MKTSATKYDEAAFDKLWGSIKAGGGITPATLFHHAILNGWTQPLATTDQDTKDIKTGRLFAEANRGKLLFIPSTNEVLKFTAHGWVKGSTRDAELAAKAVVTQMRADAFDLFRKDHTSPEAKQLNRLADNSSSAERIRAMIEMAKSEPYMSADITAFDANPNWLGVKNGVLDIENVVLLAVTPSLLVSKRANVLYDRQAKYPQWQRFLEDIQPDSEIRRMLKQLVGVFLSGDVTLQKMIFFYGQGANGKSTFIEVIASILGDYAKSIQTEMLMHHQRSPQGPSADIVSLKGRRLVYCNEVEEGRRLAEARVKELTGGDTLAGRVPYAREEIAFQPTHKLVMIGNHKPEIHDMSYGMWRRMLLIPFDQIIPRNKRDPNMVSKLKNESSGILNWALDGYRDYRLNGLCEPQVVTAATDAYKSEMDILGEWLKDSCTVTAGGRVQKDGCYRAYGNWARSHGHYPLSQTKFTRKLSERGFKQDAGKRNFEGLVLNDQGLRMQNRIL